MNIERLSEVKAGGVTKETSTMNATAYIDLPGHKEAIEIHAHTLQTAQQMRAHILEQLTGEPIPGPLMFKMEFKHLDDPQIELLNALDALRCYYTMVTTAHKRIGDEAFARALRYLADVVESE